MAGWSVRNMFAGIPIAAAMLLAATPGHATTYYLQNVTFDDGTKATGFFSTGITDYPANHSIITATGAIAGYHYTNDINVTYNPGDAAFTVFHSSLPYEGYLTLAVGQPLAGVTHAALLTGGVSLECSSYNCPNGTARNVVSGFLTTSPVPEPASWTLMLGGFGVIGTAMRRRNSGKLRPAG